MKIKVYEEKEVELSTHEEAIYKKGKMRGQIEMFIAWLFFVILILLVSQIGK